MINKALCTVSCPINECITMNMGFFYPSVNMETCIDCDKCEKVCPELGIKKEVPIRLEKPLVYASYSKNKEIRLDSTSGGIFSELV